MKRHFEQELESLKTTLIKMASVAEEAVRLSIKACLEHDLELAKRVIDNEDRMNVMEIEIDNAIIDLLALQQPVAIDLRLILAAQKINNDLERIGDHAVNIAESAMMFAERKESAPLLEIPRMSEIAELMLRDAIDSFIHQDPELSTEVLQKDDMIDQMNVRLVQEVVQKMKTDMKSVDWGIDIIRVSRNLERIADLATNIAEEVIFVLQARVVKHQADIKRTEHGGVSQGLP